jgi:hypothetical protein
MTYREVFGEISGRDEVFNSKAAVNAVALLGLPLSSEMRCCRSSGRHYEIPKRPFLLYGSASRRRT